MRLFLPGSGVGSTEIEYVFHVPVFYVICC